jgi:hypothetical protein
MIITYKKYGGAPTKTSFFLNNVQPIYFGSTAVVACTDGMSSITLVSDIVPKREYV